jgi:hypothetical protein
LRYQTTDAPISVGTKYFLSLKVASERRRHQEFVPAVLLRSRGQIGGEAVLDDLLGARPPSQE